MILSMNDHVTQRRIQSKLKNIYSVGSPIDGEMGCRLIGNACRDWICRYPSVLKQRQQHADSSDRLSESMKTNCKYFRFPQLVPRATKALLGAITCEDKSSGGCDFCKMERGPSRIFPLW